MATARAATVEGPDRPTPDEQLEQRLADAEARLDQLRRQQQLDHRARLATIEQSVAEAEHRARRDAEQQHRAIRAELRRERFARAAGDRQLPSVGVDRLRRLDPGQLRIRQL